MTKAESVLEYYDSEDFKDNYVSVLREVFFYTPFENIKNVVNNSVRVHRYYGANIYLDNEDVQKIKKYIEENFESFISDFNGYHVGDSSLTSISFGEQQEEITLCQIEDFEKNGFVSNDGIAYYDMASRGIHVDIVEKEIPLLKKLINQKIKSYEN